MEIDENIVVAPEGVEWVSPEGVEWVGINGNDNYTIEQFEIRAPKRKPLILKQPDLAQLLNVTMQYLGITQVQAKVFLKATIVDTPDPLTLEQYFELIKFLETNCTRNPPSNNFSNFSYNNSKESNDGESNDGESNYALLGTNWARARHL